MDELKTQNETLTEMIKRKDSHILDLENKVEQLEQYTRTENLIISGLEVKQTHSSYSSSVRSNTSRENEVKHDLESIEKQVIDFFEKQGLSISESEISACHPLGGKKPIKDIVLRFVSRKSKSKILTKVKKDGILKATNVFVSEHLTKKNQELAAIGRHLKKSQAIVNTWVRDGKIFVRTKGKTPEEERTVLIKDKATFEELELDISNLFQK